jgi:hypothetical protein
MGSPSHPVVRFGINSTGPSHSTAKVSMKAGDSQLHCVMSC